MCAPTHQNFVQKFLRNAHLAHFPAKFTKFQIFLEQSIFVVQKRLIYEKASTFDEKYDEAKIKRFA